MDLTLYQLFRNDVAGVLTPITEEVIEQATSGDTQAREAIIVSCAHYVMRVALTYTQNDPRHNYNELIGVGNLAAVECLSVALTKRVPLAYLRGCIKMQIKQFVNKQMFTSPLEKDVAQVEQVPVERDYSWLYEAIQHLSPWQIDILSAHFGLFDTKESLYEQSKQLSSNTKGTILYLRLYRAMKRLREVLAQTSEQGEQCEAS